MALKTKGAPKAGPKKRRAKSEADKIAEAIREHTKSPKRATRKAGRVRTYRYKSASTQKHRANGAIAEAMLYQLRRPKGLSLEAQWMERRLEGWCPLDWWEMFDRDKSLWPYIIELVKEDDYGN